MAQTLQRTVAHGFPADDDLAGSVGAGRGGRGTQDLKRRRTRGSIVLRGSTWRHWQEGLFPRRRVLIPPQEESSYQDEVSAYLDVGVF